MAIVLALAPGLKEGADKAGMTQAYENRLVNAIGEGSGGCVQVREAGLSWEENEAMEAASEEARQKALNTVSPKQ